MQAPGHADPGMSIQRIEESAGRFRIVELFFRCSQVVETVQDFLLPFVKLLFGDLSNLKLHVEIIELVAQSRSLVLNFIPGGIIDRLSNEREPAKGREKDVVDKKHQVAVFDASNASG